MYIEASSARGHNHAPAASPLVNDDTDKLYKWYYDLMFSVMKNSTKLRTY